MAGGYLRMELHVHPQMLRTFLAIIMLDRSIRTNLHLAQPKEKTIWVVVKIMVPFWVA